MNDPRNQIAPLPHNGAALAPFLTRRIRRWGILVAILWLALFLRVWQLDVLPPGLQYDEAFNGTVARGVLRDTSRPIFFTGNFGEEPLHMYTEAVLFELVGDTPWAIRLTSAVFGFIFVVGVYACARAFFPRSDVLALSGAFIAATLYWSINFSRIGIETNSMPPVLALSAAALGFAYRRMTWRWVVLAGFFTGAEVYTYLASRLWLVAVLLWFLYFVIFHRARVRAHWVKWAGVGLVAFVTLAPLAFFFLQNPVAFAGRSGTVFTPETLGMNILRTAGMFLVAGDTDPRDNLPGRPALDFVLAPLFVIGLVLALVRFRKPFYSLLIIWLGIMLLPSALTEFAPNFRRAIGALPAAILLCALGLDWLWQQAAHLAAARGGRARATRLLTAVIHAALAAALGLSASLGARAYFVEWGSGTGLFYSFDVGILQVATALAARPAAEQLCMSPNYDDHYTVRWALENRRLSSFDGRRVLVLPDSSRPATCGIITREDPQTLDALMAQGAQILRQYKDASGAPYATLVEIPPKMSPPPAGRASMGDFATLIGTSLSPVEPERGAATIVNLRWRARQSAPRDYTVFVQLLGPTNPATGSPVWAQDDKQPGGGTYPTSDWQSGETIIENYTLKLPNNAPPGRYTVEMGMYLLDTGERVPLVQADGVRAPNDALVLAAFQLN